MLGEEGGGGGAGGVQVRVCRARKKEKKEEKNYTDTAAFFSLCSSYIHQTDAHIRWTKHPEDIMMKNLENFVVVLN